MITAKSQRDLAQAYRSAYKVAVDEAEADIHGAWREYIKLYSRRPDGRPLMPGYAAPAVGASPDGYVSPTEVLPPNHPQGVVRTIAAATLNRNPEFSLSPRFPGQDAPAKARIAAAALNKTWTTHRFNSAVKRAYYDSLIVGRGWCQVGWRRRLSDPIDSNGTNREVLEAAKTAIMRAQARGMEIGMPVYGSVESIREGLGENNGRLVLESRPTMSRVSPFDMFYDPSASDPMQARWVAHRWRCPVDAGMANERWAKSVRSELRATPLDEAFYDPELDLLNGVAGGEYQGNDYVWVVDFFDVEDGTWCQFPANATDGFLLKPQPIPLPFGQPFEWIDDIQVPNSRYPASEVEVIFPHQMALRRAAERYGKDFDASEPKYFVAADQAEKFREALESDDSSAVHGVDFPQNGQRIQDFFGTWQGQSRSAELMQQIQSYAAWIAQGSGVTDYMRGFSLTNASATEVNALQTASATFMGEKASAVRDFIGNLGSRVFMMMQQYSEPLYLSTKTLSEDETQILDETVQVNRDNIAGAYEIIVSGDSTERKTPEARAQHAQQLVSTLAPFMQMGTVDPVLLVSYVLKEGFGITDPTRFLTGQAAPQVPGGEVPGISMTSGAAQAQMGASVAMDRAATGETIPTPTPGA